ncbi:hypothetical protein Dda_6038 [Drechslerella dactyloides]|uniref:DNA replication regulator Sld3 C-terminal domain-containing protein n=1 Tax=Drechslerella dactyloides TaxID=74499 RepID=A0AAD6IZ10_DREDA|nr:hypothetical protein Dda_6038 [Drechslerella dactyloides]
MRFVKSVVEDTEGPADESPASFSFTMAEEITNLTGNGDPQRQASRPSGAELKKLLELPAPFLISPGVDIGDFVSITPAAILPRDRLDLDWANAKNEAQLFEGDIPVLGTQDVVMVVKVDNSKQFGAVQRVGFAGHYTLFRLSKTLKLKEVRAMAAELKKEYDQWWRPTELKEDEADPELWWGEAELGENILSNALRNAHVTASPVQVKLTKVLKAAKALTIIKNGPAAEPKAASDPTLSPESCLSQLKQQYYTLLYTSKSPLQYLPKSSLSRARVVFQTSADSPSSRLDLLLFLENMVLPIEDSDEKYRTALLDIARTKRGQIGIVDKMNNEDLESAIIAPACLKDNEIKYVLKWLRSLSEEDGPVRSLEQEDLHIQRSINDLRYRESELQIILLLEIISIKSKLSPSKLLDYDKMKKADERKRRRREKARTGEKSKKRKKMEPTVLLDLLVDRLCIWNSIGASSEAKGSQPAAAQNRKDEKDRLRLFCAEIVLAYYSSRLPSICEDIKFKCTGKIKQAKKEEKQVQPQEEQSMAPQEPNEDGTLLSASLSSKPVFSRSLTAPAGRPHFERADSTVSASFHGDSQDISLEIAAKVSQEKEAMKTSFRGGITNTKRTADKRVVEVAKRRKVANEGETDLKDAIKNIAKPNRLAVAEEMVSARAERMKFTGRKPKKTFRNPLAAANTVQVAATPRKNARTAKLVERKPDVPSFIAEEEDVAPSSSQVVPQSTLRQSMKRKSMDHVEATPSKGPRVDSIDFARLSSVNVVPQSTIKTVNKRKSAEAEATPSKAPRVDSVDRGRLVFHQQDLTQLNFIPSSPSGVAATPLPAKRSLSETFKLHGATKSNIFMSGTTPTNPFRSSSIESRSLAKGFMNSIAETPTKPNISSKLSASLRAEIEDETIASSPLQKPKPGTPANRELIARNIEEDIDDDQSDIYQKLGWDLY